MKCLGLFIIVLSVQSAQNLEKFKSNESDTDAVPVENEDINGEDITAGSRKSIGMSHEGLTGSLRGIVEKTLTSFSSLHNTLDGLRNCESAALSSVSKDLFMLVDNLSNINGSSSEVFSSLSDAIPAAFSTLSKVVTNLNIGVTVNEAITVIQEALRKVTQIADGAETSEFDIAKEFDNAIVSLIASVQVVIMTVAIIAEAAFKELGKLQINVREIVISLTLVVHTLLVFIESIGASMACVMSSLQTGSFTLNTFLEIIGGSLEGTTSPIWSKSRSIAVRMSSAIDAIKNSLTPLTVKMNEFIETIQSRNELEISSTLERIVSVLGGSVGKISGSITSSITSIASSITTVASSESGLLTKVTVKLYAVFQFLLKLNGSNYEIVAKIAQLLTGVIDTFKIVLNHLSSGIGSDVIVTVTQTLDNIQVGLGGLLSLLSNGKSKTLNVTGIEGFVKEIAQGIQNFASAVVAISLTVHGALDSVNAKTLESVLALQFIQSAILYLAQWVLSIAASVFASGDQSPSGTLYKLTILMSTTLETLAKITATISESLGNNISDIVISITPLLSKLGKTINSSFSPISGVVINIEANIGQLAPKDDDVQVQDIVNESVSQILGNVTGPLSSVSSVLSSTLFSLTSSFKNLLSSHISFVRTVSKKLISALKQITDVTDSPSEILLSTSNRMRDVFSEIFYIISELSELDDVGKSFHTAVTEIQNGLQSLISAINEKHKDDLKALNNPTVGLAQNIQVLIGSFFALVDSAVKADVAILNQISQSISIAAFVVSTAIFITLQVICAGVITLSATFGRIITALQELTLALSAILESSTSITANIITLLSFGSSWNSIVKDILFSVANLNGLTTSSISVISGVLVKTNVSLSQVYTHTEL